MYSRSHQEFQPDIIGITVLPTNFTEACKIAELAKATDSNILVIVGGPATTFLPRRELEDSHFDMCVIGEGEQTLTSFLEMRQRKSDCLYTIPGLLIRDSRGMLTTTGNSTLVYDLDTVPFPDYTLITNLGSYTTVGLVTSRGCPSNCSFCSVQRLYSGNYRQRSAQNVVDEIKSITEILVTQGMSRQLTIVDDTFTADRSRVFQICESMQQMDHAIPWDCCSRVLDLKDEKMVSAMKLAGCAGVFVGIESGSPRTLKEIRKGHTVEHIREVITILNAHGIKVSIGVILGFPWETEENIRETITLLKSLPIDGASVTFATPLPGTDLFELADELGYNPGGIPLEAFNFSRPTISPLPDSTLYRFREEVYEAIDNSK
ncbi:B12-binding domain-containing radical SAM protein [Candidatus Bipolaricaulota bacterium]|nr:B12-binding domain-containing radical SAM protein [Candidatus Bipolaricaulota bacterium]